MTVPVRIVPLPLILKQWSANMINFLSTTILFGTYNYFKSAFFRLLQYYYTFYLVEYGTIVTFYPNLVLLNILRKAFILGAKSFYSRQSTLLITTINFLINISAIIMH